MYTKAKAKKLLQDRYPHCVVRESYKSLTVENVYNDASQRYGYSKYDKGYSLTEEVTVDLDYKPSRESAEQLVEEETRKYKQTLAALNSAVQSQEYLDLSYGSRAYKLQDVLSQRKRRLEDAQYQLEKLVVG